MTTKKGKKNFWLFLKLLDDLVNYFATFGEVIKVIIPFDATKKSHEFKGYALVTFTRPEVVNHI